MLVYLALIETAEEQHKFEAIYTSYKQIMFYTANGILNDVQDAEDTVHEAFLKIIDILNQIEVVDCPQTKSLIVTITENKAIDLYRRKQNKRFLTLEESYVVFFEQDSIDKISEREIIAAAIAKLPVRYRTVLILKYSKGYSMDEIAEILSMTKENVKKTIQRARGKLESILSEQENAF